MAALLALCACDGGSTVPAWQQVAGGDAKAGRLLIDKYGCGACHTVPGVRSAKGRVGPPLGEFGLRGYIAGIAPNRPETLTDWLRNPPALSPQTAMPNLGITDQDSRDLAAFLYTLR